MLVRKCVCTMVEYWLYTTGRILLFYDNVQRGYCGLWIIDEIQDGFLKVKQSLLSARVYIRSVELSFCGFVIF